MPRLRPPRPAPTATGLVAGVLGGVVVALALGLVALLPQITPASTASVVVPSTRAGHSTVTVLGGARIARYTAAVAADGVTVTGATVTLLGLHLLPMDIRIGAGAANACSWRAYELIGLQSVSTYQCDIPAHNASNAAVVIRAGIL